MQCVQCLAKVVICLEPFHILTHVNRKLQCVVFGFYVVDQLKRVQNCEAEGKFIYFPN